jgi:hypothetical protein|uniref:Uncharacterized protein n=1 Tax=viral metagenome TaxID=1070528 RepID=A0A6C0ISC0_9ZZZZ
MSDKTPKCKLSVTMMKKDIHARRIQRQVRKNNVLKQNTTFKNLELSSKGKTTPFADFTKYIRQPHIVSVSNNYINCFKQYKKDFKLNSRVLITAYLITYYQEELLGKELHQLDQSMLEWSLEVVKRINLLDDSKDIDKLWLLLQNYQLIFNQWKDSDKSRMVESIIISYYNRCKHIEKINADEKLSNEDKEICINELNIQKREVLGNVKFFDPNFDVEYFVNNYEEVYNTLNDAYTKLSFEVVNTMKKAFYDMLKEEISENNFVPIAEVMVEISKRLLILIPEKKREKMSEKINIQVIVELLSDKSWTTELKDYLKFICESVFVLGASCDDEKNKLWLKEVDKLMEENYNDNLPLILIQIEEKLDRIFELINELNKK